MSSLLRLTSTSYRMLTNPLPIALIPYRTAPTKASLSTSASSQPSMATATTTTIPAPVRGKPPPSLPALLSSPGLLEALSTHSIPSPTSPLPSASARLSIARALTAATGTPLPSHAYARMQTAEDGARWYAGASAALRPAMPGAHAVRLVAARLGGGEDGVAQDIARAGGVVEDGVVGDMRLPENLKLDPRTFRQVPKRAMGTAKAKWRFVVKEKDGKRKRA